MSKTLEDCGLAVTGGSSPTVFAVVAVLALVVGVALMLFVSKKSRGRNMFMGAGAAVMLMGLVFAPLAGAAPAQAATAVPDPCVTAPVTPPVTPPVDACVADPISELGADIQAGISEMYNNETETYDVSITGLPAGWAQSLADMGATFDSYVRFEETQVVSLWTVNPDTKERENPVSWSFDFFRQVQLLGLVPDGDDLFASGGYTETQGGQEELEAFIDAYAAEHPDFNRDSGKENSYENGSQFWVLDVSAPNSCGEVATGHWTGPFDPYVP